MFGLRYGQHLRKLVTVNNLRPAQKQRLKLFHNADHIRMLEMLRNGRIIFPGILKEKLANIVTRPESVVIRPSLFLSRQFDQFQDKSLYNIQLLWSATKPSNYKANKYIL